MMMCCSVGLMGPANISVDGKEGKIGMGLDIPMRVLNMFEPCSNRG
jgi:hypothetical protein